MKNDLCLFLRHVTKITVLTRELKLKLNRKMRRALNSHLWHLTGVYNWAIQQIQYELKDCASRPATIGCLTKAEAAYFANLYSKKNKVRLKPLGIDTSEFALYNKVSGNAKKMDCEVSNEAILSMIYQARNAWDRCLSGVGKRPRRKGARNRLCGFSYYGDCKVDLKTGFVKIPKLGRIRFKKFDIGSHLTGKKIQAHVTLKRRADGWYVLFRMKADHQQVVLASKENVGIDPGMKNLVTLSNGERVAKNSSFAKKEDQLARIQKGVSKNLELAKKLKGFGLNAQKLRFNPESKVARLHLKVSRQRKHENHQTSHNFVKAYSAIFWSDDNFKAQQNLFGKQIMSNAPGQLRDMIAYKSSSCGRQFLAVSNHNSTVTCHVCKALTGPCGRAELKVREWVCSSCGTAHDRDKNAAINTLNSGLEHSLEQKGLTKKLVNPPKKTKQTLVFA